MQDNEKKPALRFKGFTDPWEQRKLAELTKTITTGKSVNSDEGEVSDGNIGVLKTSCVSYDRFNPSESKPVVKSEQQLVKCAVEKDSVIVSRMNTPERVGACGYVSTDFPNLFLPDRLWKLKFQDTVDTYFVYMMLVSSAYKEKITSMASGTSGSMYNIPKETFLNLQLVIPAKIDEQKQLGKILKKIDTLITLHQRKYEKLVNIKKSMLDKMFPKNGASVPEIRFKGFTDPWEQRKVGTLIEDYTEKTVTQNQYPVLTSSQQQGIVLQEDYFADRQVTTDNNVGYYVLPKGYFTYRSRSDTDVFVFNRNNIVDKGIISYYYPVFAPKSCDSNFLLRRLNHGIKKQLSMAAEGTGQKVLAHAKFKNMVVDVPSQSEQEKIGTILEELDTLITLHQRKLEKLQNIKKSCLEKMFV